MAKYDKRRKDPAPTGREIDALFDKLPPHAQESEIALLGSIILAGVRNDGTIDEVQDIIRSAGDFYFPKHQAVYDACMKLWADTGTIDTVQLTQVLRDRKVYEEVGGIQTLVEMAESTPTSVNAPHYARIVAGKAKLRDLLDASATTVREIYEDPEVNPEEMIETAEQRIFEIADKGLSEGAKIVPLSDQVQDTFNELMKFQGERGAVDGLTTSFRPLDELLGGMHGGEVIILGARPSMGKTAIAMNIGEHVAVELNVPIGMFSLEMSKKELAHRLLCSHARVDSKKAKRNMINGDELRQLENTAGILSRAPIFIDDTPALSISQIRSKARRMKASYDIGLLIIDYLQLVEPSGKYDNRTTEVGAISRGVKAIARELEIPVLCLSQLNRKSDDRASQRPMLSDLRESGAIEQDADVVLLLHREEQANAHRLKEWRESNPMKIGLAELICAKQRNGPIGTVNLHWHHEITRFGMASLSEAEIETIWNPGDQD